MTTGWSIWVIVLVVLNMGITFFLLAWSPRARIPVADDGTTGHVWSGGNIREGLHRLPRWWILFSLGLYIGTAIYLARYPGFGANKGTLNWTSVEQVHQEQAENQQKLDQLFHRFDAYSVAQLSRDPRAMQVGQRLFGDNCEACHRTSGTGDILVGAPNLTDSTWLYGGTGKDIQTSISAGRDGVMPAWHALGAKTVNDLVQYVLSLSGQPHNAAMAKAAEPVFASTCAACHGKDGTGNQTIGAPNLTDDVWKWGGTEAEIHRTIDGGRQGHMPTWSKRLSDSQIHVLAAYVYHLSHQDEGSAQ